MPDDGCGLPAAPTLREVLRVAGQEAHTRLDDRFGGAVGHVDGYVALLSLLGSFHAAADPLLARWAAGSPLPATPVRASLYAGDLRRLGQPAPPPMDLGGLARARHGVLAEASGLALLYVVAGSTVGARHLLRMIPTGVPASARRGLEDAGSAEAGQLWRATRDLLAAPADRALAAPAGEACAWLFGRLLGSVEGLLAA